MNSKYHNLIKDLFLFAISVFIPKAISFFLVPLYTNCLTTKEYGIVDMIGTTTGLIIPFLTLDINDAVLRFTIEKKTEKKPLQVAYRLCFYGIVLLSVLVIFNILFGIYNINIRYQLFFVAQYVFTALYGINISYIRATDRVSLLSAISIINTIITVSMNILLLLVFDMGINGYLLSNTIGLFVVNVVIAYKINIKKLLYGISQKSVVLQKQMLQYSVPLVASNIAWWVNSASDRYIVTLFKGIAENGIYSVAYKIPTILQLLQSVFSQAWLLSVYKEYDKEDGNKFVENIYDLYNSAMCISCSFLIIIDIPMAKFLYAKDFFYAWKYVPVLLISVVFIANAGFFESIITLFKKSKIVASTAVAGAAVNIILNIILIYYLGVMGAAIATAGGYFVMWVLRVMVVEKDYPFYINWIKHSMLIAALFLEAFVMVKYQNYFICILLMLVMCIIDYKTLINIIKQFYKLLKRGIQAGK